MVRTKAPMISIFIRLFGCKQQKPILLTHTEMVLLEEYQVANKIKEPAIRRDRALVKRGI